MMFFFWCYIFILMALQSMTRKCYWSNFRKDEYHGLKEIETEQTTTAVSSLELMTQPDANIPQSSSQRKRERSVASPDTPTRPSQPKQLKESVPLPSPTDKTSLPTTQTSTPPTRVSRIPVRFKDFVFKGKKKKKVPAGHSKIPTLMPAKSMLHTRTRTTQTDLEYGASFTISTVRHRSVIEPKPKPHHSADSDTENPYNVTMLSVWLIIIFIIESANHQYILGDTSKCWSLNFIVVIKIEIKSLFSSLLSLVLLLSFIHIISFIYLIYGYVVYSWVCLWIQHKIIPDFGSLWIKKIASSAPSLLSTVTQRCYFADTRLTAWPISVGYKSILFPECIRGWSSYAWYYEEKCSRLAAVYEKKEALYNSRLIHSTVHHG